MALYLFVKITLFHSFEIFFAFRFKDLFVYYQQSE